jgi:hypothetical protein
MTTNFATEQYGHPYFELKKINSFLISHMPKFLKSTKKGNQQKQSIKNSKNFVGATGS